MLTTILGGVGCGKSVQGLNTLMAATRPRLIVDPMVEHYLKLRRFHPSAAVLLTSSLDELLTIARSGLPTDRVIVHRTIDDLGDYRAGLFDFLESLSGWCILLDEIDTWCSPWQIDDGLRRLLNYRRHLDIDLIAVARRPAALHGDVCALADEVLLFNTYHPRDLDFVSKACGPQYVDPCHNLIQRQFLRVQNPPPNLSDENPLTNQADMT